MGGVCLRYVGLCWLFKCGSVRVVKGVWVLETQKEGKKSIPKGREAGVTSTVRERSHANNARLLCLACQLKTSLASQEHAYRRRFCFLECWCKQYRIEKTLVVCESISIIIQLKSVPKAAQFWAPKTGPRFWISCVNIQGHPGWSLKLEPKFRSHFWTQLRRFFHTREARSGFHSSSLRVNK